MRGTLIIWHNPCRAPAEAAPRPKAELHFNVWRDVGSRLTFLDIGLRFPAGVQISGIKLFVPSKLRREQVQDLSQALRDQTTLKAVFNEVIRVDRDDAEGFLFYVADRKLRLLEIKSLHLNVSPVPEGGSIISVSGPAFDQAQASECESYARIRLSFVGSEAGLFASDRSSRDKGFAPSVAAQELTEFRLNERRNYPDAVAEEAYRNRLHITAVHYFLIRDTAHTLSTAHSDPKKVRRLEPDLWAGYLAGVPGGQLKLPRALVDRALIYHWTKKSEEEDGVDGFVAFAAFSLSNSHLLLYSVAIVLLGAAGSAIASCFGAGLAATWYFSLHQRPEFASSILAMTVNGIAVVSTLALVTAWTLLVWVAGLTGRSVVDAWHAMMRRWDNFWRRRNQ